LWVNDTLYGDTFRFATPAPDPGLKWDDCCFTIWGGWGGGTVWFDDVTVSTWLLYEDFEAYVLGQFPDRKGWFERYGGTGHNVVDDAHAHSGGKAIRLQGQSGYVAEVDNFAGSCAGRALMAAEFWLYPQGGDFEAGFNDGEPAWGWCPAGVRFHTDGVIYAGNQLQTPIRTFTSDRWYKVKFLADSVTRQFALWVNDTLYGDTFRFATPAPDPGLKWDDCCFTIWGGWGGGTVWFDDVTVSPETHCDVGAAQILVPSGTIGPAAVTPRAVVRNFGGLAQSVTVQFRVRDSTGNTAYSNSATFFSLAQGASCTLSFPEWVGYRPTGTYGATCFTSALGDSFHENDTLRTVFIVQITDSMWAQVQDVPIGDRGKNVKDGGCLAFAEEENCDYCIYALKGGGTPEFYRYSLESGTWATEDTIPTLNYWGKKKKTGKGATLATGGNEMIYATKGGSSSDFWEYNSSAGPTGEWTEKDDVPGGVRSLKDGAATTGAERGDTTFVYLLRGSGTTEFYRYRWLAGQDTWERLADAPTGVSGKSFKYGSSITYDGESLIYVLKGTYNEFYAYDLDRDLWVTLETLPLCKPPDGRKKKAKDGAGIAFTNDMVYCLKGGNTAEFWAYNCDAGAWSPLSDIPYSPDNPRKTVKGGGALVATGDLLYALKGNNTLEFWLCDPTMEAFRRHQPSIASAGRESIRTLALSGCWPNPFRDATTVDYSLPTASDVKLDIMNTAGRVVTTLVDGKLNPGHYQVSWDAAGVPSSRLPGGIYFVRLQAGEFSATRKLVKLE
jgi:hypothetical protein